jgi:hypothetical protein
MSLFPQRKNRNLGPDGRKVLIIPQAIGAEQDDPRLIDAELNACRTIQKRHFTLFFCGFCRTRTKKIKIFLYSQIANLSKPAMLRCVKLFRII